MPDFIHSLLSTYADSIWMAFLGFCGSLVRVALGMANGENMPPSMIVATTLTGTILAGTSNTILSGYIGVQPGASGLCSFIIGIIGMKIVAQIMAADINIPFLKGSPK